MGTENTDETIIESQDSAAVGTELIPEQVSNDENKADAATDKTADVPAKETEDGESDADIDLEAILNEEVPAETAATEPEKEKGDQQHVTPTLDSRIKELRGIAAKIDGLPENGDANFKKMRELVNKLTSTKITELETLQQFEAFGDLDRVKEAMGLFDGLHGYDTQLGIPSSHQAADALVTKEPETAYNLALNILGKENPKSGVAFADVFTRTVLKLDPQRLADFQAISRGEIPEGYEGVIAKNEDLETIPAEFHDAYKRLSPKMREIVLDGLGDKYATAADKAEAQRLLQDSQDKLTSVQKKQSEDQQKAIDDQKRLAQTATTLEHTTTETIGKRLGAGLEKLTFSTNADTDLTMKQAVSNQIFNLVHESPYIRSQAEQYFSKLGIDLKTDRPQIDHWYSRLGTNLDIAAVANFKGQTAVEEKAKREIAEAEKRLASYGLKYAAHVARKVGYTLRNNVKVPNNVIPAHLEPQTPSKDGNRKPLTWEDALAATAQGKKLEMTA